MKAVNYLKLLSEKLVTVWGAITFGASVLVFFFGYKVLPESVSSFQVGFAMFVALVLFCGWRVWVDTEKELQSFRGQTPKFSIDVEKITRYTIKPLIQKIEKEVEELAVEIEKATSRQENVTTQTDVDGMKVILPALANAFNTFQKAQEQLKQQSSLASFLPKVETMEEKYNRLKEHLNALRKYEERLNSMYKVKLSISSSFSVENVEASIKQEDNIKFLLEDSYIYMHVPHTSPPQTGLSLGVSYVPNIASRYVPRSHIKGETVFSGRIRDINSETPVSLFDKDFYVHTGKERTDLNVRVVAKGIKPQELVVAVDMGCVATVVAEEDT